LHIDLKIYSVKNNDSFAAHSALLKEHALRSWPNQGKVMNKRTYLAYEPFTLGI